VTQLSRTSARIQWQLVPNATGYVIERRSANGDSWEELATVSGSTSAFIDTTLVDGASYVYRVSAVNSDGRSVPSSEAFLSSHTYYFSHLALGSGWQTTLTYVNYSSQSVTCETSFYSDSGTPLAVPFGTAVASSRSDTLAAGAAVHQESSADLSAPVVGAWARAQCSGPVKASLLFRFYQAGAPTGEASVNAMTAPASKFVSFAEKRSGTPGSGVAYANPSTQAAEIIFTALNAAGATLATATRTLQASEHGAANLDSLFPGLDSLVGSLQLNSSVPIVSLALNNEVFPVFSSLPPGEVE
jgi:hypothetical protein